jgi:glyoxylase-like metal-dependent hydrolase (beta-lactamase superfamily II)
MASATTMKPEVKAFFDPRTSTLTYVVWDSTTRDAVVIDPVLDYSPVGSYTWTESVDEVSRFVREQGLGLQLILETHAHADHLSGSQLLRRRFDAKLVIGERIREVQETFRHVFDLGERFAADGSQFDRLVKDNETFGAGSLEIRVIATPGHTPACVTYQIGDAIFTGDVLFMDDYGTGRCDFPKGSAEAMYDSVRRLYELPDDTRVFVGHDYQPGGREVRWQTTVGASKRNNPQLNARTTREDFVRFRKHRDAKLAAPNLLFQSVQVNIDAGRLPAPHANGIRYLNLPLNFLRPADELGEPTPRSK